MAGQLVHKDLKHGWWAEREGRDARGEEGGRRAKEGGGGWVERLVGAEGCRP